MGALINPATLQLALSLVGQIPAIAGFISTTVDMFTSGKLSEQQMTTLWVQATGTFKDGDAAWVAAVEKHKIAMAALPAAPQQSE